MTSTDLFVSGPPAWPGCALGAWAAAWLGGRCAPDDVTDTMSEFAAGHIVVDPEGIVDVADGRDARLALLTILRRARQIEARLPTSGAPQGLPPEPATAAALDAGEILLIHGDAATAPTIGLIPTLDGETCRWTVHRFRDALPALQPEPLGQVEYDLREAIRETATIISGLGSGGSRHGGTELRATLAVLTGRHQVILPPHDDPRATRVIDSAARVEAIITLAGAHAPTFGVTARHVETGDARLRRLAGLARAARAAAVNRVIAEHLPADR
ncbi:hypothetical protein GTV32_04720 [Gordonia sp. SID5947]|uniref:hypothetical protein n=1 Tax=Gordonia sp. SID5947 TaxID=2690315 RepID=UPI001368AABA|nr:hypothetical protein [Gordonia sp. SID5947]MYR05657.1 hypothetical protein [Gordonia sp. SID5947]